MLISEAHSRVDEGARAELGSRLLGGALEGKVWEDSRGGVVGQGDEEGLRGATLDGADDELANAGDVLYTS